MLDSGNHWCGGPSPPRVTTPEPPAVGATYDSAGLGLGMTMRRGPAVAERPDGSTFQAVQDLCCPARPRRSVCNGLWTERRVESGHSQPASESISPRQDLDAKRGASAGARR